MLGRALARATLVHRGWRYRTRVDPAEIRWLRQVLERGNAAVDAGAYKGGYTYWMRRAVGNTGRVFAFEPQPELAAYLRRCVRAFGWHNVTVEEAALSSGRGERVLRLPDEAPSPGASLVGASLPDGARGYPVRVHTLDGFLAEHAPGARLRVLKCDVEGHELDVFLGAERTLNEHRPLVLFECEARHLPSGSVEEVLSHLAALGYRGSFFWGRERLDVSDFDASVHQVEGLTPYGNNFVFVPDDSRSGG